MTHTFHASILREYDVRGIVGDTLSEKDARALGRSYGALAVSEGAKRIAVGRDGRTHSPELQVALIENTARAMTGVSMAVKVRHVDNCRRADVDYGLRLAAAFGLDTP